MAGDRLLEIHRAGVIDLLYATADDAVFLDCADAKVEDGGEVLAVVSAY